MTDSTYDLRADLKRKLCAAIDTLGEADGFALIVSADDVHFTRLRAAGWNEDRVLELDPLNAATEQAEVARLRRQVAGLQTRERDLKAEVAELESRRDELQAAIDNALGRKS